MNKNIFILIKFLIILLTCFICGFFIRNYLSRLVKYFFIKIKKQIDENVIYSIFKPVIFWLIIFGIYIGLRVTEISQNIIYIFDKILISLLIISITVTVIKISQLFLKSYSDKFSSTLPLASVVYNATKLIIWIIAILIMFNYLGINITPILTVLGVGGLAVALGLQDTLSNFFAGIYIAVSKQIKIGDYIRTETGQEGYVIDVGWKTTKIKTLYDNTVVIPNVKLSQIITTNYSLPQKDFNISLEITAERNAEIEKTINVIIDIAKEIMKTVKGGVPHFEPYVKYTGIDESNIKFNVILRVEEYINKDIIVHEFINKLEKYYRKASTIKSIQVNKLN